MPQLFQRLEWSFNEALHTERQLPTGFDFGIVESKLEPKGIEAGRLSFSRLVAIMPSGLVVASGGGAGLPQNTDIPSVDIKKLFDGPGTEPILLSLAVPKWSPEGRNVQRVSGGEGIRLYKEHYENIPDQFDGEQKRDIPLLSIAATIVPEAKVPSSFESIPIARVKRRGGDAGGPVLDEMFVPPCLRLRAWEPLHLRCQQIVNSILAKRDRQHKILYPGRKIEDKSLDMRRLHQLLFLRTLGSAGGKLSVMRQVLNVSPWDFYSELVSLANELAAFRATGLESVEARYDHFNAGMAFDEVERFIESFEVVGGSQPYRELFTADGGWLKAKIPDIFWKNQATPWYLSIRSNKSQSELTDLVKNAHLFKIMPQGISADQERMIGVVVEHDSRPQGLDLPTDVQYFKLKPDASSEWVPKLLTQRKALQIKWPTVTTDNFELHLCIALPETSGAATHGI